MEGAGTKQDVRDGRQTVDKILSVHNLVAYRHAVFQIQLRDVIDVLKKFMLQRFVCRNSFRGIQT